MAINLSNLENFLQNKENKQSTHTIEKNCNDFQYTIDDIIKKANDKGIKTDPINIEEVVEKIFGILIREEDLGKSVSGFLERINDRWCIYINKYESYYRKRFTIAHELAHFILHKDSIISKGVSAPDQIFFRANETNKTEKEANDFASELLLPEYYFKKAIKQGVNTLQKLSDKFELSTSAIKYRAYKLGIISEY